MPAEMTVMEKPKVAGFVDSKYNNANARRIAEAEAELEALTSEGEVEQEVEVVEAKEEAVPETGEERTYKKRYDDLRKMQQRQAEELKSIKAKLENTQERSVVRPPKSDEDIQAWADKYPDVAAIVETIAEKKAQEKFSHAEDRLQQIDEMSAEADRNKSLESIRTSHADFDDLKESDEFHDWAGEQPKWVQDALYENQDDPRSVIRVIDLYKVDNGMDIKGKKQDSKKAASSVVSKRTTKPDDDNPAGHLRESQVNRMSAQEYEANADSIMDSIRSGKFIYDISGGAR